MCVCVLVCVCACVCACVCVCTDACMNVCVSALSMCFRGCLYVVFMWYCLFLLGCILGWLFDHLYSFNMIF